MKSSPDELLHLNAHLEVPRQGGDREADARDVNGDPSLEDQDSSANGDELSPNKGSSMSNTSERHSPPAALTSGRNPSADEPFIDAFSSDLMKGHRRGASAREEHLAVVYEGKLLEYEGDDEDDDDRHIVVHEDVEESTGPKKVNHPSHVRSMSVDGIPFGV